MSFTVVTKNFPIVPELLKSAIYEYFSKYKFVRSEDYKNQIYLDIIKNKEKSISKYKKYNIIYLIIIIILIIFGIIFLYMT